jgi:hypothetical protein
MKKINIPEASKILNIINGERSQKEILNLYNKENKKKHNEAWISIKLANFKNLGFIEKSMKSHSKLIKLTKEGDNFKQIFNKIWDYQKTKENY